MKSIRLLLVFFSTCACLTQLSAQVDSSNVDINALPDTADGFGVNIVAREPHFINPAALAFDRKGRLFVGAGPQYRKPSPDTPGDYIKILYDHDEDGVAEEVKTFAEGFNNVQALAWKGDELWVANCPDVTVLRDTDGDDVADEYELVYTGLGHLRHGLHGFNWGPDGRLYMTQGNSRVQEHAPMAFRKLMRVKSDKPDNQPLNQVFTRETYKKSYIGSWPSAEGGILRCEAGGKNLEIFTRGLRNSWDMAMDTGFNWVATDNDPGPQHDRIFMPFQGAHFGMSHPWSFDWMAREHLPTVPSISKLPTVSGSGVGVVYYTHSHFPEKYQNSFLIGDWTNKRIYHFPTTWDGAHLKSADVFETLADAGRTQAGDLGYKPQAGKSLFRPTDIAVSPSGALYVAGWGAHYGSIYASFGGADSKAKKNYGRVFRIFHKERPLAKRKNWLTAKRNKPHADWTFEELLEDLGEQVPAWRVSAQDELIGRGAKHRLDVIKALESGKLSEGQETWAAWALGRMPGWPSDAEYAFGKWSKPGAGVSLNLRVQSVRIWGESEEIKAFKYVAARLDDKEPRVRFAAALALRNLKEFEREAEQPLLAALSAETDRVTFYAQWQTLRAMRKVEERREYLSDKRGGVRLGTLLSLLEEDALDKTDVSELALDPDTRVAGIAQSWLKKNGGGVLPGVTIEAPRRNFRDPVEVSLATTVKGYDIRYTLDGTEPSATSARYAKPLQVSEDLTLRAALFRDGKRRSSIAQAAFHRVSDAEWKDRVFIQDLKVKSGKKYEIVEMGLQPGAKVFMDREYTYSSMPPEVQGLTFIRKQPRPV
jgi:putative membrane-bound dehydrogenase-like protein